MCASGGGTRSAHQKLAVVNALHVGVLHAGAATPLLQPRWPLRQLPHARLHARPHRPAQPGSRQHLSGQYCPRPALPSDQRLPAEGTIEPLEDSVTSYLVSLMVLHSAKELLPRMSRDQGCRNLKHGVTRRLKRMALPSRLASIVTRAPASTTHVCSRCCSAWPQ